MSPAATRRVLFVCTGNTCRSPLARFLFERRAREAGLPWTAASAGVAATAGAPLAAGAAHALAGRGIAKVRHSARRLEEAHLAEATQVYALAREHRDAIAARFPAHAAKVAVLREAAGLPDPDVADPIGGSETEYEECARRIDEALIILIRRSSHAKNPR